MRPWLALLLLLTCAGLLAGCKSDEALTNDAAPTAESGAPIAGSDKTVEKVDPPSGEQRPLAAKDGELSINPNRSMAQPGAGR